MSSHALIQAALDAAPALAALVGDRIRPDLAREGDAFPYIVFKRTSLQRHKGLDGTVLGTSEVFEVECWAVNRTDSAAVAEQALLALDAAQLDADEALPDGIDPEFLDRVTVIVVNI